MYKEVIEYGSCVLSIGNCRRFSQYDNRLRKYHGFTVCVKQ